MNRGFWLPKATTPPPPAPPAPPLPPSLRLTAEEREAIKWCLSLPMLHCDVVRMMPLRSLLERLK
jgi:hypothetical protein